MRTKIGHYLLALASVAVLGAAGATGAGVASETTERPLRSILGITLGMPLDAVRQTMAGRGEPGGRQTRSGGYKEGWKLANEEFAYIAYKTDRSNRVRWISGFYPQGESVPFAALGDLEQADRVTEHQVIWNIADSRGAFRLVGKGQGGRASVVYLLSLEGK